MGLQRTYDKVIAILLRHPTVSRADVSHLFDRNFLLNKLLGIFTSNTINKGDVELPGINAKFLIMLLYKRKKEVGLPPVYAYIFKGSFDIYNDLRG